jgi:hypothetical protein
MRATLGGLASVVLLFRFLPARAESDDSAPPIVEQLIAHATALALSQTQLQALEAIRDRRVHTLATLQDRLRGSEAQPTAAAAQDTLTLMQDIGRLQVLSGREALQQLTPDQRRHWVALQAHATP